MIILTLVAASTLIGVILSLIFGSLTAVTSVISLVGGLAASFYLNKGKKEKWFIEADFFFLLPFLILVFFQFYYIFYAVNGWYKTANPNNLGDLPFHIQMIKSFASGYHFWPENLIYAGESLKYPFGMDFFNALLESIKVPTNIHLFLVGLVLSLVLISVLDRWMGLWGVLLVFASGGFTDLSELLQAYPWGPGTDTSWKNIILSVFITQRGFLFALPAGLFILKKFTAVHIKFLNRHEAAAFALIWGSLGIFHLHSFFIITVFISGSLVIRFLQTRKVEKEPICVFLISMIVAAPFLLHSAFSGTGAAGVVHWSSSWMQIQNGQILLAWIKNFGPWLVALFWVGYFATKEKNFTAIYALVLFFLFSHLILARWDWDQIKIIIWLYILISFYFYELALKKLPAKWHMILVIFFFFSGLIQVFRVVLTPPGSVALQEKKSIDIANVLLASVAPDDPILISPEYNHPALFLGKKVILGYPAHVWSHGIDSGVREEAVRKIYNSEEGWQTEAQNLGIKYIYFSNVEKRKYNVTQAEWLNDQNLVKKIEDAGLYDLRKNK